jgi:spore coat polysaccharide biosynthesis protein SpsF
MAKPHSDIEKRVTIVAVVQARMTSTRLPGKVLRPLAGRPVLWHVIHRLRRSKLVSAVVVATSDEASDDPVAAFCADMDAPCVRGPLDDVLARFARVLDAHPADVYVRVTGDCPLCDPGFLDHIVGALIADGGDYIDVDDPEHCIHEGIDPMSAQALRRLIAEAADDPVAREHTTGYFKKNPAFAKKTLAAVPEGHRVSQPVRISVDTPADLAFLEALYAESGAAPGDLSIEDAVRLIEARPDLRAVNAHVRQRAFDQGQRAALLVCQAGHAVGFGHLSRALALAAAFRDRLSWGVTMVVCGGGENRAREAGLRVLTPADGLDGPWLSDLIRAERPDAVVVDVRDGLTRETVETWRAAGPLVAVVDDGSDRRLAADIAAYPPVPQLADLDWPKPVEVLSGWEWVVTGAEGDADAHASRRGDGRLLVTMGGSDPRGWTAPLCAALGGHRGPLDVVIGPGVADAESVAAAVAAARQDACVHRAPAGLGPLLEQADVVVSAFGVTAYEAVQHAVPAVLICADGDQRASARAFEDAGVAVACAAQTPFDGADAAEAALALLDDAPRRARMAAAARGLVDGGGAVRLAARIAKRVEARP